MTELPNTRPGLRLAALALLATLCGLAARPSSPAAAQAGSEPMESLYVRVDDGSDTASEACAGSLRRGVRQANMGNVHITSISREVLQTRLGVTSMDGFVAWPRERFAAVLAPRGEVRPNAVTIVDCRPSSQRLDAVVFAGPGNLDRNEPYRLSIRQREFTTPLLRFLSGLLVSWHGLT